MKNILSFKISGKEAIDCTIPEYPDKENLYYKPTKYLHEFDIIKIIYKENNKKIVLLEEIIKEIINPLNDMLIEYLNNELELHDKLKIGEVGYYYNQQAHYENTEDLCPPYWLWSGQQIQTWAYSKNNKMYLEIAPSYRWLYSEPESDEKHESYEDFINKYKIIGLIELNEETAKQWLNQCKKVLQEIEAFY